MFGGRHFAFPSVQHADVATQGEQAQTILDAVFAHAAPHSFTEADGESEDAETQRARHAEVPVLVDGDERAYGQQESDDRDRHECQHATISSKA